MTKPPSKVARGEIWLVNFDPTVGDEIQKTRPAVVMSISQSFRYQLQIVVPITTWQPKFTNDFWMIRVASTPENGLDKDSTANAFQVKSLSEERFAHKIGVLELPLLEEIAAAIAICVGYNR